MKTMKKLNRRLGRPPLLETPDGQAIQDRIVQFVRLGNYLDIAAVAAGLNKETLSLWLQKGARQRRKGIVSVFTAFSEAVEKALAEAEVRDLATIDAAACGYQVEETTTKTHADGTVETTVKRYMVRSWQAAAWKRERREPERWGRRYREIVQHADDATTQEKKVLVLGGNGNGNGNGKTRAPKRLISPA